jgi:hypothetical protein
LKHYVLFRSLTEGLLSEILADWLARRRWWYPGIDGRWLTRPLCKWEQARLTRNQTRILSLWTLRTK